MDHRLQDHPFTSGSTGDSDGSGRRRCRCGCQCIMSRRGGPRSRSSLRLELKLPVAVIDTGQVPVPIRDDQCPARAATIRDCVPARAADLQFKSESESPHPSHDGPGHGARTLVSHSRPGGFTETEPGPRAHYCLVRIGNHRWPGQPQAAGGLPRPVARRAVSGSAWHPGRNGGAAPGLGMPGRRSRGGFDHDCTSTLEVPCQ